MNSPLLAGWENFYVIVGSAAGGLTGLTFVVIALVRDARAVSQEGLRAFVTPTIVHFSGVLAIAAWLSMPHRRVELLSVGLLLLGLSGAAYTLFIGSRLGRVGKTYVPVREDWIFNVIAPAILYLALCAMSVALWIGAGQPLFGVAIDSLLLLLIAIRNAWDIAVWMTTHEGTSEQ